MKNAILLFLCCLSFTAVSAQCFVNASYNSNTSSTIVNFTNTSSCNSCVSTNYLWQFGDGNFSTLNSPSHSYTLPGVYFACLIATGTDSLNNVCVDSFCQQISIFPGIGCFANMNVWNIGNVYNFSAWAMGTTGPSSFSFDFGDGSPIQNVAQGTISHTYNAPGTYVACVTITDTTNTSCTTCDTVVVSNQGCITQLTHNTSALTANFAAVATGLTGPITYTFDYGDGSPLVSGLTQTQSHTYTNSGTYIACVTATDTNNTSCTDCDTVIVGTSTFCNTNLFSFVSGSTINGVANATSGQPPYTYSYTLNPGNITNSNGVFTGLTAGNYTLCATATDVNNVICSSDCDSVSILINNPCIAQLTSTVSGNNVNFNTVVNGSAAAYNYSYNFGDGSPIVNSNSANVNHTYLNPGTYYPCVTATDTAMGWNSCTSCDTVVIPPAPCGLMVGFNQNTTGLTSILTNTTVCNSCVSVNYSWDFGDGNSSTMFSPTHTYANAGNYLVTLTVVAVDTNNNTCIDSITATINAQIPPPCQIYLTSSSIQLTTTFTPVVTNAVPPLTYFFDYGDGTTGVNNIHTYPTAGTYNPCITVTDANNDTCSFCDTIVVATAFCNTYLNTNVSGSNISSNASAAWGTPPYTYSYTLMPGNVTNTTGQFSGLNTGVYTVCATATDANNVICSSDCDSISILINNPCIAQLNSTVNGNTVNFNTTVSGSATYTYSYNFGDGSPIVNSNSANVNHTYLNPGTYYPCVTATDTAMGWNSCTSCDTVVIPPAPCGLMVGFNQNTTGLTSILTNTTVCNSCVSVNYSWDFGDGNSSTMFSPTHTYANAGNYLVTLTVVAVDTNNNTCIDSITATINAQIPPPCQIYLTSSSIQLTTTFTPVVTNAIPPLTYFFDYGDGTTGVNNIHTYPTAGTYNPCITVTDANNDTCSFCDTIVVATAFCNTYLNTNVSGSNISSNASAAWGTPPYTYSYTLMPGNVTNTTGQFSGLNTGVYTVCATATDANNVICSSDCDSISILINNPCIAQLNSTVNGNTVNFNTTVSGSATYTYSYNFGDGSPIVNSNSANVNHTYLNPGTYYPCVTATDTAMGWNSCTSCDTVLITSGSSCTTTINAIVNGTTAIATASASGGVGPYTYSYTLNPGNVTNNTGIFAGLNNGIYLICATAFDTITQTLCSQACDTVSISNSTSCSTIVNAFANSNTITTIANTTGGLAPYSHTYVLTPGNITNNSGVFSGVTSGAYVVCVYSVDANLDSCAVACDSVLIGTFGGCSISAAFTETISGLNVNFANTSGISGGVITNYGWSFGDGNTSGNASPNHTYATPGTYQVILGVTGLDTLQNICVDTISKMITVGPTSVPSIQKNSLTIYPNPTSASFVIEIPTSEKLTTIEVTDVSGRKVAIDYQPSRNQKLQINLKNSADGIYFIKLQTNKNFYTSSIMKQE